MKAFRAALAAAVASGLLGTANAQDTKTFVAEREFCSVVIHAGNIDNPTSNPVVFQGGMSQGQRFPYNAVFLFAQREANPGNCSSGRGNWIRCSWGECRLS